jgi:hypothetical protein
VACVEEEMQGKLRRGLTIGSLFLLIPAVGGCGLLVCQADKEGCPPASADGRILVDRADTVSGGEVISMRVEVQADGPGSLLLSCVAKSPAEVSCEPVRLDGPGKKSVFVSLEKGQAVRWTVKSEGAGHVSFRTTATYVDLGFCGVCLGP